MLCLLNLQWQKQQSTISKVPSWHAKDGELHSNGELLEGVTGALRAKGSVWFCQSLGPDDQVVPQQWYIVLWYRRTSSRSHTVVLAVLLVHTYSGLAPKLFIQAS